VSPHLKYRVSHKSENNIATYDSLNWLEILKARYIKSVVHQKGYIISKRNFDISSQCRLALGILEMYARMMMIHCTVIAIRSLDILLRMRIRRRSVASFEIQDAP
jgi:hypothetical protein